MNSTAAPTVEQAVHAVSRWLAPVREKFRAGEPVLVTMSPGEGTKYTMLFVPAVANRVATTWRGSPESHNLNASDGVVVNIDDYGSTASILPVGLSSPDYIGNKLGLKDRFTEAAIGVVTSLMTGTEPATVARAFASHAEQIARWNLTHFEPPAAP